MFKRISTIALVVSLCTSALGASATFAAGAAKIKKYSNCKELNKDYPGGVSKSASVKNKGGKTKLQPRISSKVYLENASKDRDKDGIACEK